MVSVKSRQERMKFSRKGFRECFNLIKIRIESEIFQIENVNITTFQQQIYHLQYFFTL